MNNPDSSSPISKKRAEKEKAIRVHNALKKLKYSIDPQEVRERKLGKSTQEAIRSFQKDNRLKVTGLLNAPTLEAMNKKTDDQFYSKSKARTAKFHAMLEGLGYAVDKEEKNKRQFGDKTRLLVKKIQKSAKLKADGNMSKELVDFVEEKAVEKKFQSKTQTGKLQRSLQRALSIAKIPAEIEEKELQDKKIGDSSKKALAAFQEKYNLSATGELNKATVEKIQSVASSKGVKKNTVKKSAAGDLRLVRGRLSINKQSAQVKELQKILSFLNYPINADEFSTQTFGKSTYHALVDYQASQGLPQSGKMDSKTAKSLNMLVASVNPESEKDWENYRIKGSVRNELHERAGNHVLHIHEQLLNKAGEKPLMTKKNHSNGFFDIVYDPPIDKLTGQPKERFHLLVKLFDGKDNFLTSKVFYNVSRTQWVNFNLSDVKYQGDSLYAMLDKTLGKALGDDTVLSVKETEAEKQVTQLSIETGISTDELMRYLLSHHLAEDKEIPDALSAEVFFALVTQSLPQDLPADLLQASNLWETFPQLVENAKNGIVFTDSETIEDALDHAISQNLVPLTVKLEKEKIQNELSGLLQTFSLEKPILTGNSSLKTLLDMSKLDSSNYAKTGALFLYYSGATKEFWKALESESDIKQEEIENLYQVVQLGDICKNYEPNLEYFLSNIGSGQNKPYKQNSDLAKLSESDFYNLIKSDKLKVPDYMPGDSDEERSAAYAATLSERAEYTFPLVSLIAEVKRGGGSTLKQLKKVEEFYDRHSDVDFRSENLDDFIQKNELSVDEPLKEELKLVQRVNKLHSKSAVGRLLIEEGFHSSSVIYQKSKTSLGNLFEKKGLDRPLAYQVYEQAKTQYALILAKWLEYAPQLHWGNPQALPDFILSQEELEEVLGDIPNLESLFGSMDYCACDHCKSLYGPAAYLTDLLRFLHTHDSLIEQSGDTLSVREVLLDRRPDLGNIKLNCDNTNTPMPYIDLVCEILENHVSPQQLSFNYQSTRPAAELLAMPEHIRPHAYRTLADSDFPMDFSFNLWQEEARTYLNFLRVPRHELMAAFQTSGAAGDPV
ncbi:MAG: peptidoglycan-binding protein, partial [Cytophagales bacterium]|nr:peptidoglycan-binding protein [Cytophagales bacterium]